MMTPAPAAPLPVLPFLPIRPLPSGGPIDAPTSAPLPLYAGGFGEILAGRQQVVAPAVAPTIAAETSVEPAIAPVTGETALPIDMPLPDMPLPESVALVSLPAATPVRALPTPVQDETPVADTETPLTPLPPSPTETIVSANPPAPLVQAEKPPVSRDLPTKTPPPPKTPDVSRVLPPVAQAVSTTAQPMAKRETPIARRIQLFDIAPTAEGEAAPTKPGVEAKSLWTALIAQSQGQPEQQAARAQDTPPTVTFGPSSPSFEALTTTRPSMPASDITQIADRVLDVARGNAWIDQLAADISAAQKSDGELNFRLIPARLGQLDVQIATRDTGMELSFSAQNDEAASIVAAAQPRLVEELRNQGVRVAGSEVGTAPGQSGQHQSGHQHSQRQQSAPFFDQQAQRPAGNRKQAASSQGRFA
jgi:flagellar hook-length control protein FliK